MAGELRTPELLTAVTDFSRYHIPNFNSTAIFPNERWRSDPDIFTKGSITLSGIKAALDPETRIPAVIEGNIWLSDDPEGKGAARFWLSPYMTDEHSEGELSEAFTLFREIVGTHKHHEVCPWPKPKDQITLRVARSAVTRAVLPRSYER